MRFKMARNPDELDSITLVYFGISALAWLIWYIVFFVFRWIYIGELLFVVLLGVQMISWTNLSRRYDIYECVGNDD